MARTIKFDKFKVPLAHVDHGIYPRPRLETRKHFFAERESIFRVSQKNIHCLKVITLLRVKILKKLRDNMKA